jgi:hypothetical protein
VNLRALHTSAYIAYTTASPQNKTCDIIATSLALCTGLGEAANLHKRRGNTGMTAHKHAVRCASETIPQDPGHANGSRRDG